MDFIQNLNYELGQAIGVTFLDPQHFFSLLIRFIINLIVVTIIARVFYFPKSRRRDYMFIFINMAMSIFMLVSLMEGDGMNTGAALGLFAIFGIMRFRTEAVPIREMTYLFMLIALSVVNALARGEYHPKTDYWDGVGLVTLLFVNFAFVGMAWLFESSMLTNTECSKYILYDNVSLLSPDKRDELKADLEKRTGLKINRVEVGTIDFLKDSCIVRIYYENEMDRGSSIQELGRMPK